MKNKIISVIISACMIFGLIPVISLADAWDGTSRTEPFKNADGAYEITNAAELAWFANNSGSNNAVLTGDIDLADKEWTPIASTSSAKYIGIFDGNGHAIRGLKISADAQYLGLFGYIGSGGEVKNLSVKGDVEYTGTSSSQKYTGGIAGQSDGIIECCISDVNVTGNGYCGGITAFCCGGKILNSASKGTVTGKKNYTYTGGIAGMINGSSIEIENVYNTGDITSVNNVGGIAGYIMSVKSITAAYSAGAVTCTGTSSAYKGGCIGNASSGFSKLTHCYFLKNDNINKDLTAAKNKTDTETVCGKDETAMKSDEFLTLLGAEFVKDSDNINNGYPILAWQKAADPEPTEAPTAVPTAVPTAAPTATPTAAPTSAPTSMPTATVTPSVSEPTDAPSPTAAVTPATPEPTDAPSPTATVTPATPEPTDTPSPTATVTPSVTAIPSDNHEPEYLSGVWQISTADELVWFAGYVNGTQTPSAAGASYDAALISDINLGGIELTPIGIHDYRHAYSGTFDGKGHTISGISINNDKTYQGLFGIISQTAVIKNLTAEGNIISLSADSKAYIGGICGYNDKGKILNCINKVNVTSSGGRTGGICGASAGDGSAVSTIAKCANYGNISYETGTGQYRGGITGEASYTVISECSNSGSVTSNGNFTGGIAGDLSYGSLVTDSYNTGKISSSAFAFGGIAGRMKIYASDSFYGIVSCYSIGEVNSLSDSCQNYGALIGIYSGGINDNCYCLIENDGINSGLSAIGKIDSGSPSEITVKVSADEMRGILDNLNLKENWTQSRGQNDGYPILKWQYIPQPAATLTPAITAAPISTTEPMSTAAPTSTTAPTATAEPTSTPESTSTPEPSKAPESVITIDGVPVSSAVTDTNAGGHKIEADYSQAGKDTENGLLMLAVYDSSGALIKVLLSDRTYKISAECDIAKGDIIKILFWDSDLKPVADPVKINAV